MINEELKEFYAPLMDNKGINLKAVGSPSLENLQEQKNNYNHIIYAPHWTINHETTIAYSTFKQTGKFILDYAQKHPEFNWVFKPHPMLKKAILDNKFMTEDEVNEYYTNWEKLGIACYDGNYFEIFNDSQLMITDCCTFLIEYLATGNPLIRLVSKNCGELNANAKEATNNCYNVENIEELNNILDNILIRKQDFLQTKRIEFSKKIKQKASLNIIQDLLTQIKS